MITRLCMATLVGALVSACATRGTVWDFPDEVATSGTGPFRTLMSTETQIPGLPLGRVVAHGGVALESGMGFEGRLVYAAAQRNDAEAPEESPTDSAIDWTLFDERRIYLSPESTGVGYSEGSLIEIEGAPGSAGSEVFDPWLMRDTEGGFLLLFATADGAYTARSDRVEGPYQSPLQIAGTAPTGRSFRRPTAVSAGGGAYHVYLTDGAQVYRAEANADFTIGVPEVLELASLSADDEGRTETAVMNAAPLRAMTPTGRTLWRLYFEAHRSDGSVHLGMAASEDGVEFERFDERVFDDGVNPRFPAPILDPPYTTRLILSRDHVVRNVQLRALIGVVTPIFISYPDPEEGS